jgi:hypothetical protein
VKGATHNPQRNSERRRAMLAERRILQIHRLPGFTPMRRRPAGHMGKWNPAQEKTVREPWDVSHGFPHYQNRRTGEAHEHSREKARRLKRIERAAA